MRKSDGISESRHEKESDGVIVECEKMNDGDES